MLEQCIAKWRAMERAYLTPVHKVRNEKTSRGRFTFDMGHTPGDPWNLDGVCIQITDTVEYRSQPALAAVMLRQLQHFRPQRDIILTGYEDDLSTWEAYWLGVDERGVDNTYGEFASLRRALVCGLIAQMLESGDMPMEGLYVYEEHQTND